MLEILQHDGALAHPDGRRQATAGRLVAHVRAVREIIGAELAHEDRIQERGFIGRAAGGVELGLVRAVQRLQVAADQREGIVPAARHVVVGGCVVAHRLGQPALHLQPVVGLRHQFGHGVPGEQFAAGAELGGFPGQCLRAVLAELQLLAFVGIGERTAGALEATGLIHRQQCLRSLADHTLLQQHLGRGAGGTPASGGLVVGLVTRRFLLGHVREPGSRNATTNGTTRSGGAFSGTTSRTVKHGPRRFARGHRLISAQPAMATVTAASARDHCAILETAGGGPPAFLPCPDALHA